MNEKWQVNDRAAYHTNGRSLYGTVVKVNAKSIRVKLDDPAIGDNGMTTWSKDDRLLHHHPGNPGPWDVFKGTPMTYVPIMSIDKAPITSTALHRARQLGHESNKWNVHLENGAELVYNTNRCMWYEQGQ